MIVVTASSSNIGNQLIKSLNAEGFNFVIEVEEQKKKSENKVLHSFNSIEFLEWLPQNSRDVECVFHIQHNFDLSFHQSVWQYCIDFHIPYIYLFEEKDENTFSDWAHKQEKKPFFNKGISYTENSEIESLISDAINAMMVRNLG